MASKPIDSSGIVRCIGCRVWIKPGERLPAAYRSGRKERFYVCKACMALYREPQRCSLCNDILTPENGKYQRYKNGLKFVTHCRSCHHAHKILDYRQKQQSKLSQKLKDVVR